MPPQTPLVLVDNVFDRINLYPLATLSSTGDVVGREFQYVADYRRERTFWQAATTAADRAVLTDLGAGNTAVVDSCWIDRGHNLWGKNVAIEASDNAFVATPNSVAAVVPAAGTVGGDPSVGWCVTEEGALYTLFAAFTARRYFRIRTASVWGPIIPGVILGKRIQLARFSNVVDDDAGERSNRSTQSMIPGYSGDDRSYSARKTTLDVRLISSTEYDAVTRTLRRLLFDVNQCAFVCMNWGDNPERGWLYKYQGNQWSSPKERTYRKAMIQLYEYGPLIR